MVTENSLTWTLLRLYQLKLLLAKTFRIVSVYLKVSYYLIMFCIIQKRMIECGNAITAQFRQLLKNFNFLKTDVLRIKINDETSFYQIFLIFFTGKQQTRTVWPSSSLIADGKNIAWPLRLHSGYYHICRCTYPWVLP